MAQNPITDFVVDASGLHCPMPLLKLRQTLKQMQIGQTVQLTATDPNSNADIKLFCEKSGQQLVQFEIQSNNNVNSYIFTLKKSL